MQLCIAVWIYVIWILYITDSYRLHKNRLSQFMKLLFFRMKSKNETFPYVKRILHFCFKTKTFLLSLHGDWRVNLNYTNRPLKQEH